MSTNTVAPMEVAASPPDAEKVKNLSNDEMTRLAINLVECHAIFLKFYNFSKDYYFDSYAHFGIHEEMLKDETRTLTYR